MHSLVVGKDVARRPAGPNMLKKYSVLAAKKSVNRGNKKRLRTGEADLRHPSADGG